MGREMKAAGSNWVSEYGLVGSECGRRSPQYGQRCAVHRPVDPIKPYSDTPWRASLTPAAARPGAAPRHSVIWHPALPQVLKWQSP